MRNWELEVRIRFIMNFICEVTGRYADNYYIVFSMLCRTFLLCMSSVGAHIVRPSACGRWWDEIWDKARHAGRWQASSPTDWILGLRQIFRFLHGAMGHRALQIILLSITHFQMSPNLIFLSGAFALRSTIIIHYSLLLILFIPPLSRPHSKL